MLTFLFPYLDLYSIGGFNNPLYQGKQRIRFEH